MSDNRLKKLEGKTFNDIEVISFAYMDARSNAFYNIKCKCGNLKVMNGTKISTGRSKTCGCGVTRAHIGRPSTNRLEEGEAHFNMYYKRYKHSAKKRLYSFNLTKDDFRKITSMDCHYCGVSPKTLSSSNQNFFGTYTGNGIDRKDNTIGYELGNCIPCCKTCNIMKSNHSYGDFMNKIRRIYEHLELYK